jgi:hypothetical protein
MPALAAAAVARLRSETAARRQHLSNALEDAVAGDAIAEHIFIAAALQLHAARLAALLPPKIMRPVGTGICPACGGAPVASVLVDRPAAHNARYCVCATCATQWNTVRVSCVLCGSTDGIAYFHIEDRDDGISAETCESCRGYVKLLSQVEYPNLDPVVDDVASLFLIEGVAGVTFFTLLVLLTGGVASPFFFGYFLVVAAAALVTGGGASLVLAAPSPPRISAAAGHKNGSSYTSEEVVVVAVNVMALWLLSYLASVVAGEQRRT